MVQHVYIIGSKGIPARYGGYETFVERLTAGKKSTGIMYHIAARTDNSNYPDHETFIYNNAQVFTIKVPEIGPAQAILYDLKALRWAINDAKQNSYERPIFYILACRIGPFIGHFLKEIHRISGRYYINPDGHEWKRAKWSVPVRHYWKVSERLMVKLADLVICDNRKIEEYIRTEYASYNPKTIYIAYGTDIQPSSYTQHDEEVKQWYKEHQTHLNGYFLIVGRFVPENNYETMIREFMKSSTNKDLVIVTNVKKNKFYNSLIQRTRFDRDKRIKFVGTVYNQGMLKFIRENAYAYIHGHEVGGTNPSLLEALSSTHLNLLVDVDFNRDVAQEAALYWTKDDGNLAKLIDSVDTYSDDTINEWGERALSIVKREFTWPYIIHKYEDLFA